VIQVGEAAGRDTSRTAAAADNDVDFVWDRHV
jgi:hypothetical protein